MSSPTTIEDDRLLVHRVRAGERTAFGQLIRQHERLVSQIIYKLLVGDDADRQDVLQDVFLKVYTGLGTFHFQARLSTWIARIAYTTCLHALARRRPEVFSRLHQFATEPDAHCQQYLEQRVYSPADEGADVVLHRAEMRTVLTAAIDQLPPLLRTLLTLYHTEELSYEEIAQVTGLPLGTVKSYLFRARKLLRERLLTHYTKDELW